MAYIIVADDDPLLCELVRFRLEAAGHRVDVIPNGHVALAAISTEMPALLILDSMMPVLSGLQVLHHIKSDPATAALPVIMLTARKGQEDVLSALQSGATDYMTKPFMPDELLMRVSTILARSGGVDAVR